jgi:hypothetical protein
MIRQTMYLTCDIGPLISVSLLSSYRIVLIPLVIWVEVDQLRGLIAPQPKSTGFLLVGTIKICSVSVPSVEKLFFQ